MSIKPDTRFGIMFSEKETLICTIPQPPESVFSAKTVALVSGDSREQREANAKMIVDTLNSANDLRSRIAELEAAIVASHSVGSWGPVEDAYAAGGHPCLRHRHTDPDTTQSNSIETSFRVLTHDDCDSIYDLCVALWNRNAQKIEDSSGNKFAAYVASVWKTFDSLSKLIIR